jgi:hypothetical protein
MPIDFCSLGSFFVLHSHVLKSFMLAARKLCDSCLLPLPTADKCRVPSNLIPSFVFRINAHASAIVSEVKCVVDEFGQGSSLCCCSSAHSSQMAQTRPQDKSQAAVVSRAASTHAVASCQVPQEVGSTHDQGSSTTSTLQQGPDFCSS